MTDSAITLTPFHHVEADGTHTVTVEISGMRSLEVANRVSVWMRDLIRANAHLIGRLEAKK